MPNLRLRSVRLGSGTPLLFPFGEGQNDQRKSQDDRPWVEDWMNESILGVIPAAVLHRGCAISQDKHSNDECPS
jgi:hypothetical protein